MTATDERVSAVVRSLDPYPGSTSQGAMDERRMLSSLDEILAAAPMGAPAVTRGRRGLAAAGTFLVAAAVAGAIVVSRPTAARPGVTELSTAPVQLVYAAASQSTRAPESLVDFADRVQSLPAATTPQAPILALSTRSFDLLTVVGDNGVTSTLEEHHTQRYIADGSITTRGDSESTSSTHWGQLALSADVETLRDQLAIGHPEENGVQSVIAAIGDLYREESPSPAVRAAILRLLAEQPGVTVEGAVTDRAGRAGVGYSIRHDGMGLPVKATLIFDVDTGALQDLEVVLTETAGKLNVPIPSVISYEIFGEPRYVTAVPPASTD